MKLENQVISIPKSIRLCELGILQKSLFYHTQDKTPTNPNLHFYGYKQANMPFRIAYGQQSRLSTSNVHFEFSAFTASEICDMLPDLIEYDNLQYELVIIKEAPDTWLFQYSRNNDLVDTLQHVDRIYEDTIAQAAASMLIHLLEINKITAEEINKRLTE